MLVQLKWSFLKSALGRMFVWQLLLFANAVFLCGFMSSQCHVTELFIVFVNDTNKKDCLHLWQSHHKLKALSLIKHIWHTILVLKSLFLWHYIPPVRSNSNVVLLREHCATAELRLAAFDVQQFEQHRALLPAHWSGIRTSYNHTSEDTKYHFKL